MSKNNDKFVSATPQNNNDFIDSLDNLTVDDVVPPHRNKHALPSISGNKISRFAVLLLCIAVFLYCAYELTDIIRGYRSGDDLYNDILSEYLGALHGSGAANINGMELSNADKPMVNYSDVLQFGPPKYTPVFSTEEKYTNPAFQKILTVIEGLRDDNADTYGWIEIPETQINYPMVQCGDNDFYLTHAYNKHPQRVGAIFIDFRNSRHIEDNSNIIIYGHNMMNDSMFHDVEFYFKEDFFMDEAHNIIITTFDARYTFEVFSVYETIAYDQYFRTHFASDEDFLKFCTEREAKSKYHKPNMSFTADDVLITLSTCKLGYDDGRYAVHAKLVKVEK